MNPDDYRHIELKLSPNELRRILSGLQFYITRVEEARHSLGTNLLGPTFDDELKHLNGTKSHLLGEMIRTGVIDE